MDSAVLLADAESELLLIAMLGASGSALRSCQEVLATGKPLQVEPRQGQRPRGEVVHAIGAAALVKAIDGAVWTHRQVAVSARARFQHPRHRPGLALVIAQPHRQVLAVTHRPRNPLL